MTNKMFEFHTINLNNAMRTVLMLCMMLCLTVCLPVAGCGNNSAETRAPSTKETEATRAEPTLSQSSETTDEQIPESSSGSLQGELEITLNYKKRDGIASNQYAVWIEDSNGTFIRTLFATSFTTGGGWEYRPESLAAWVERSGLEGGTAQEVDAYSGATPKSGKQSYIWDCKDESGQVVPDGEYHFFVEGTIYWEDAVIFEGVIDLGSEETTAQAEASFTNDEAKKSDMITDVVAVYRP